MHAPPQTAFIKVSLGADSSDSMAAEHHVEVPGRLFVLVIHKRPAQENPYLNISNMVKITCHGNFRLQSAVI